MKILGIESSCDEKAAAVVEDGSRLLANVVNSQIDLHKVFGGVVPEVAARSHLEIVLPVVDAAVRESYLTSHPEVRENDLTEAEIRKSGWREIDAIACTTMPGLIGSLLIGSLTARTIAFAKNIPFYPIHHVEAHVYANFITEKISRQNPDDKFDNGAAADSRKIPANNSDKNFANREKTCGNPVDKSSLIIEKLRENQPLFPMLALIVSGGHSQIVLFKNHGNYRLIGQTQDDAVGEAFDKVAKILGLPYPGGPSIEKASRNGDSRKYHLPKAHMAGKYDFSFSGLKTAVLRAVQAEVGRDHTFPSNALAELLTAAQRDDFAASFTQTAVETLAEKMALAVEEFHPRSVVIAGGVAASQPLRNILREKLPQMNIEYPPMYLCTDNAAMVASLGYFVSRKISPTDPRSVEVLPSISMTKTAWDLN